jgi:hypothetical protein
MVKIYRKLKRWLNYRIHGTKKPWIHFVNPDSPNAAEQIFTNIYSQNVWQDSESVSGAGSNLMQTKILRERLPGLFKELGVQSILDIPCGDFHWLSQTNLNVPTYVGADIVDKLVATNQARYQRDDPGRCVFFTKMNLLTGPLPRHDLILCRDCLVHFSNADVSAALRQTKNSGSTYLLTTSFPFPRQNDKDIQTGDWRALNLEAAPFNLPKPLLAIVEGATERKGRVADKTLALWKIADLPG